MKKLVALAVSLGLLSACGNKTETKEEVKIKTDSVSTTSANQQILNDSVGIYGIINVPEILTLSIKDSAAQEDIGFVMGKDFDLIEKDMQALHLNSYGLPAGTIYYNNNPKNFIFECIIPINKMPEKQPKHSKVVVLEATRAVLYKYYGPYEKIHTAYDELGKFLTDNKLQQTTPLREFYFSDPLVEKDPQKWLTKIYIPVK